jgi:DNA-binding NtrC family response regulator
MPVLALIPREMRADLARQLASVDQTVAFIDRASELFALIQKRQVFSVAVLPASLPDADIWALWGELKLLSPHPEILLYARTANFQVWSGVLEAGGHDVLVEPFSADELLRAVLHAQKAFEERIASSEEAD